MFVGDLSLLIMLSLHIFPCDFFPCDYQNIVRQKCKPREIKSLTSFGWFMDRTTHVFFLLDFMCQVAVGAFPDPGLTCWPCMLWSGFGVVRTWWVEVLAVGNWKFEEICWMVVDVHQYGKVIGCIYMYHCIMSFKGDSWTCMLCIYKYILFWMHNATYLSLIQMSFFTLPLTFNIHGIFTYLDGGQEQQLKIVVGSSSTTIWFGCLEPLKFPMLLSR